MGPQGTGLAPTLPSGWVDKTQYGLVKLNGGLEWINRNLDMKYFWLIWSSRITNSCLVLIMSHTLFSRMLSLVWCPALGIGLVVPNFLHFRMKGARVVWQHSAQLIVVCSLLQIWAWMQSRLSSSDLRFWFFLSCYQWLTRPVSCTDW